MKKCELQKSGIKMSFRASYFFKFENKLANFHTKGYLISYKEVHVILECLCVYF